MSQPTVTLVDLNKGHFRPVVQLGMLEGFLDGGVVIQDHHVLVQDPEVEHGPVLDSVLCEDVMGLQAASQPTGDGNKGPDEW